MTGREKKMQRGAREDEKCFRQAQHEKRTEMEDILEVQRDHYLEKIL